MCARHAGWRGETGRLEVPGFWGRTTSGPQDGERVCAAGGGGKFRLGYSGELAVSEDHFIVAAGITQKAADNDWLLPMLAEVERHSRVRRQQVLADSGFYRGSNLEGLEAAGIDGYIPDSVLARELNL